MLSSELGEDANNVGTTVLSQCSWDDFESASKCLVWPLLSSFNVLSLLHQSASELHFKSSATWAKLWVEDNVSCDTEGVVEVSLDFVKDILGCTSENNRASIWLLAVCHKCEVIVTNLLNLESTALSSNIRFLKLLRSVDNGSSSNTGDSVVVGLPQTSEDSAVAFLQQEVLGNIRDTLLSDDDVWLDLEDGIAHSLDLDFFHGQSFLEIVALGELHVGH